MLGVERNKSVGGGGGGRMRKCMVTMVKSEETKNCGKGDGGSYC